MFYTMIYGTLPFRGKTDKELREKIKEAKVRFPRTVPITEDTKQIIKSMLDPNPETRLDLLNLMEMPYTQYDDEAFEELVHKSVEALAQPVVEPEEEKDE